MGIDKRLKELIRLTMLFSGSSTRLIKLSLRVMLEEPIPIEFLMETLSKMHGTFLRFLENHIRW